MSRASADPSAIDFDYDITAPRAHIGRKFEETDRAAAAPTRGMAIT